MEYLVGKCYRSYHLSRVKCRALACPAPQVQRPTEFSSGHAGTLSNQQLAMVSITVGKLARPLILHNSSLSQPTFNLLQERLIVRPSDELFAICEFHAIRSTVGDLLHARTIEHGTILHGDHLGTHFVCRAASFAFFFFHQGATAATQTTCSNHDLRCFWGL